MGEQVGYCIFFPPGYDKPTNAKRRYPVVYFLHGGRPGNEWKCVSITHQLKTSMQERKVAPAIYVFVNGGKVSHYNTPQFDSMGEDVFVKELIPHVDNTHRTIAARHGRALEGFSQGGRGTARIAFKHPHVFCSAAPGGAGYATEKKISESGGHESERLFFGPGYNTWDLAAKHKGKPDGLPALMIYVGTKGFNYENNLDYMTYLEGLGIPFQRLVVPGAKHSLKEIYEANGIDLMRFHATNFKAATAAEKSKE